MSMRNRKSRTTASRTSRAVFDFGKKAFSVMTPLHDRAAASLLLRSIRILALVNLGLC